MAELNELLEEAATRCGALSDELSDTAAGVRAMADRATGLWDTASGRAEEARRRIRDLSTRLDAVEDGLEKARGEAVGHLDGLGARAVSVRDEVRGLLDQVRAGLDELETHRAEVQDDVDSRMQAAAEDFDQVSVRVRDVGQAVEARLQQGAQAIAELRAAVEAARAETLQRAQTWTEAADALEAAAQEQARRWTAALQGVLADQTTAMVDMANRMLTRHNEVMEELKQAFTADAATRLAATVEPLRERLERLGEVAESRRGDLSARAEESLQRVRAALPLLDELKAAFESSSRLT